MATKTDDPFSRHEKIYCQRERFSDGLKAVVGIHNLAMPDHRANFAMSLLERWAAVAATANGEDSAGRQKIRTQTPKEIVQHCCNVSEAAFKEFASRGWYTEFPDYETTLERARKQSERN